MLKNIIINKYFHIISLLVLAFMLRFWYINTTSIGGDECFSLFISQYSISEIVNILSTGDNPPLWEILLHYWSHFFGNTVLAIRILPLLFNVLTVIPIYIIGKKYFTIRVSLVVCFLFIFSSFSLFMAHEARIYSLVGLISTISMLTFLNFMNKQGETSKLILLTFLNALLLYSHYLSAWILIAQCIAFVLLRKKMNVKPSKYLLHLFLVFIALIPFIPIVYNRFMDSGINGTWVPKVTGLDSLYFMLWSYLNKPIVVVFSLVFVLIASVKVIVRKKVTNFNYIVIHLWCWLPLIISFLLSFKVSFFLDRYLYFILPGLYFSITLALDYVISNKKWNVIFLLLFVVFMAISFKIDSSKMGYSGHHPNTKLVANIFSQLLKEEQTMIISCPNWYEKELMYYLDKDMFCSKPELRDLNNVFQKQLLSKNICLVNNYSDLQIKKGIKRIVYFDNNCDFHCSGNQIYNFLSEEFLLNYSKLIDGKRMYFFDLKVGS